METLEIVTFKLNPGITEEQMLAAAQATFAPVKHLPGFRNRKIGKDESAEGSEGVWYTDCVTWATLENAKSAAAAVMEMPEFGPYAACIHMESLMMKHSIVHLGE